MHSTFCAIAVVAAALFSMAPVTAQSLFTQLERNRISWEMSLDVGDGQKVRQAAEELLKKAEPQISQSNYNDLHAKAAVLGIAARGAVLEGDWARAVSLLGQASSTADTNFETAGETLGNLRKQHETKISEWKALIQPQEEQLQWLKSQPGLTSEQIRRYSDLESFLAEHHNAISNSEHSIKDIDEILAALNREKETCARSLSEWNDLMLKESAEIRTLGSPEKYVRERLENLKGSTSRSRFERISYARRLMKIDPANEECLQYLNILLGNNKPDPKKSTKK